MLKAVVYDFDGTLTPDALPKFAILEKCGLENGAQNPLFLERVKSTASEKRIGMVDAMIETILSIMREAGVPLTNKQLCLGAEDRVYNPGVEEFLSKLKNRGIRNYLLSSGAKVYLEKTKVAPLFDDIYASTVSYDENGKIIDTEYALTEPEKAVVLRKIAELVNGNPEDCSGIMYIGDGPTDLFAMDYVKAHGGVTIMVHCDKLSGEFMSKNVAVNYDVVADYRDDSELNEIVERMMV